MYKVYKDSDFSGTLSQNKDYYLYTEYASSSSCSGDINFIYAFRNGACNLGGAFTYKYPNYKGYSDENCGGAATAEYTAPTGCYTGDNAVEYAWALE
jgi:hypothetical protein